MIRGRIFAVLFGAIFSIILVYCVVPSAIEAAMLVVASNGIDNGTCGGMNTPCRSINQAIGNAFDGDRIVVGHTVRPPSSQTGPCVATGCVSEST